MVIIIATYKQALLASKKQDSKQERYKAGKQLHQHLLLRVQGSTQAQSTNAS